MRDDLTNAELEEMAREDFETGYFGLYLAIARRMKAAGNADKFYYNEFRRLKNAYMDKNYPEVK